MMKETETISGNKEAVRNISGLFDIRMKRGLTRVEMSRLAGVNVACLRKIEVSHSLPTIKNYNKLANFLGWKKISVSQPPPAEKPCIYKKEEDLPPIEPVKIPGTVSFIFEKGHSYQINEKAYTEGCHSRNSTRTSKFSWNNDYVFRYEGKQGIHHCFRELRGNWTRTYTDAQLIGKEVKEV